MSGSVKTPSPQDLLREFARLNRLRRDAGVTPLEFQRWLDLRQKLEKDPAKPKHILTVRGLGYKFVDA